MKTPPPGIRVDLPFDAPPITKNKVRRLHYQAEAKMRREIVEQVRWAIKAARIKPVVGANVTLHWRMPDKRRRDGDGAAPMLAACIDGLVRAGILPDDDWSHVPHSGITCHPPIPGRPGAMWLELAEVTWRSPNGTPGPPADTAPAERAATADRRRDDDWQPREVTP